MLESGGALKTYRLELPPAQLLNRRCAATQIRDHPLRFLVYEGSVNKGFGKVRVVDSGTYHRIDDSTESFRLDLSGKILQGQFRLTRIEGSNWKFGRCRNGSDVG